MVCKLYGNIYDTYVAIVFGTLLFSTFWRLWKLFFYYFFDKKVSPNLIFTFSFYPKNSKTSSTKTSVTKQLLVVESFPTSLWVTLLIFCRLVYNIPSHLNDLILASSASLRLCQKLSHQYSRLVFKFFLFLKQAVSVIHILDLLIVIELSLWNWKEI